MSDKATVSLFIPQAATAYSAIRQRAQLAETLGYRGYWVVDHVIAGGAPDLDFLEGWTTVAGLAEATETLRIGVLVTCNSFRNPGMLAKAVATADHISNGRVELGMGAGWMEEEYRAYGFDFPSVGVRLAQLGESLEVITSLFANERTTFNGEHYTFRDAPFAPKPLQSPLPITIGGGGKRVLMRLVAKYAQCWNCSMPTVPDMADHLDALQRHCDAVDRNFDDILISEQAAVVIGADEADYKQKRELANMVIGGFVDIDEMAVCGTPDQVTESLRNKMRAGVRDFTIVFGDFGQADTLELFAERVLPQLEI
jgi:F420-dependent oxidoreductase-like protein